MNQSPLLILHADDDDGDRLLFGEALSCVPISTRLISLSSGEQLLNYLSAEVELPSVIFLDLNMPKISGFDCLTNIKNTEKLESICVVICSTSGDEKSVQDTFNNGAQLYIIKPFNFDHFPAIINKALIMLTNENFEKPPLSKFVLNKPD
ncbi:MAG: response regulator [Bacteroidota bacterium]